MGAQNCLRVELSCASFERRGVLEVGATQVGARRFKVDGTIQWPTHTELRTDLLGAFSSSMRKDGVMVFQNLNP